MARRGGKTLKGAARSLLAHGPGLLSEFHAAVASQEGEGEMDSDSSDDDPLDDGQDLLENRTAVSPVTWRKAVRVAEVPQQRPASAGRGGSLALPCATLHIGPEANRSVVLRMLVSQIRSGLAKSPVRGAA